MEISNINITAMSDKALLDMIGDFIKDNRIRQNKTQQDLAAAAGINRTTLVQIERGGGGKMLTFIQIMRALDLLYYMNAFEVKNQISPVALANIQLRKRQRASSTNLSIGKNKPKSNW